MSEMIFYGQENVRNLETAVKKRMYIEFVEVQPFHANISTPNGRHYMSQHWQSTTLWSRRVTGYRSRASGFDSRRYQIFREVMGSGTRSTQTRQKNWGTTWKKKPRLRSRKLGLTAAGTRYPDRARPLCWPQRSLSRYSFLVDWKPQSLSNLSTDKERMHWRMPSSGMLCRVDLVRTDVSEEHSASTINVTRIGELGTTLDVTSNQRTLRRNAWYLVLTRASCCNILEDDILHSHRRENLKYYIRMHSFYSLRKWHICNPQCT
jgi:hypothetical protein